MAKSSRSRRETSSRSNGNVGTPALPGNIKPKIEKGGSLEDMEKKFRAGANGDFLRIGKDEEYVLAILEPPEKWDRIQEHGISLPKGSWAYLPCFNNCPACARMPDNPARVYAMIPVYVYEYKKVQYYRAPGTVVTDLISKYKRNKSRFLDRQYILIRHDGEGAVRYDFELEDGKVTSKVRKSKLPDLEKGLISRWQNAIERLGWNVSGEKKFDDDDEDDPFDHEDEDEEEDIDIDDISGMNRKELVKVIDEHELDIEDTEDIKLGALRRLVIASFDKDDDEDEEDEDED